jgi:WXXGXW repeat (2 copies)
MMRTVKIATMFLLLVAALALPSKSQAQIAVGVSIHVGPPALPVYVQPACPAPGYIWTPGYWAYGPEGYYWVPGTWVLAPAVGLLWTPGYWGWGGGGYLWHAGYWGPHVGFYGGINYGFGYTGVGFAGGYWRGGVYNYNRSVTNVNTTIVHNTYNTTVINNNTTVNRTSFNGGTGGTAARPNAQELAAERETHKPMTAEQTQHSQEAGKNRAMLAAVNNGHPSVAATPKPGVFHGPGAVAAHPANAKMQADRPPSARTSGNGNANPQNAHVNSAHPSEGQKVQNTSHTNTQHENAPHANSSRPPQPQAHPSHPTEPQSHPGGGHPGGKLGR